MKGVQGLVIAGALGIVGALCNWFYITRLAENKQMVSFVLIDRGAQINVGDRFTKEHFGKVDIPRDNVGNLMEAAVLWEDRNTAIAVAATKSYRGGEILLQADLRTPARRDLSEMLSEKEVARWVPVDSRTFVPEKVNPSNLVSFIVPQLTGGKPLPGTGSAALAAQPTEVIGPFRILALGTRTGRREVRRAAGLSSGSEYTITISVTMENGRMEPRAQRLFDALRATGNKGAHVMLHSSKTKL